MDLEASRGRREKDRVEEEGELATLEAADEEDEAARRGEERADRRIETDREDVEAMVEEAEGWVCWKMRLAGERREEGRKKVRSAISEAEERPFA